jgi:L-amino acid N-acyltransferase YncA
LSATPAPLDGDLRIRPCEEEDLATVGAIYGHYVLHSTATFEEEPPGTAFWQARFQELRSAGLPFLVATLDGTVVAYAYISRWRPRPAYRFSVEDSIYVSPAMVGRGIGGRLLPELLSRCRDLGLRQVMAVISTGDNDASVRLHAGLGFVPVGTLIRVGYKFDRWLDTVIMQLSLE